MRTDCKKRIEERTYGGESISVWRRVVKRKGKVIKNKIISRLALYCVNIEEWISKRWH